MKYSKSDCELMKNMADNLENYLEVMKKYMIIKGLTKDEYDHAVKLTKKLIKKLRKTKGDDVFDEERFCELKEKGKLNSNGI